MSAPTYRRGQVDWALWRVFNDGLGARTEMPSKFATRIKRLLEIDRAGALEGAAPEAENWAFSEQGTTGTGSEAAFTGFDTFCLAQGLDLLDIGFKQAEIVFLLRHIRPDLRKAYRRIGANYPRANRQKHPAQDYPKCPTKNGGGIVDADVYLLVSKVELTEILPASFRQRSRAPVIAPPAICFGHEALSAALARLSGANRKVVVIEIAGSARLAPFWLEKAPLRARGRTS